jgi:glutathione S-transferase
VAGPQLYGDDEKGNRVLKLFIGNKAYSSWSLRGWLACKQSGLQFEEITVPMFGEEWDRRNQGDEFAPSGGKVPILWDEKSVIWDSLAIVEWLADKTDRARFWPEDDDARGMARSMAAEMHSSYPNLRRECPMNVRKVFPRTDAVGGHQEGDHPHPGAVGRRRAPATAAAALPVRHRSVRPTSCSRRS